MAQMFCRGLPDETERPASDERDAQAHHASLRLGGNRRLSLIA
jgi:hypothetical protein